MYILSILQLYIFSYVLPINLLIHSIILIDDAAYIQNIQTAMQPTAVSSSGIGLKIRVETGTETSTQEHIVTKSTH